MGSGKKKQKQTSDDEVELSGYETQFIPQSDDDEKLWSVEEILQEKGNKYLLKWAGVDDNGKPWPNSWVPKHDVTNDLIVQWKELKKQRKQEKEKKKKLRQNRLNDSNSSYHSTKPKRSRSSVTTSSTNTNAPKRTRRSTALEQHESIEIPTGSVRAGSSTLSHSSPKKRKRNTPLQQEDEEEEEKEEYVQVETRPRKRQRDDRDSVDAGSPLTQRTRRSEQASSAVDSPTSSKAAVVVEKEEEEERRSSISRHEDVDSDKDHEGSNPGDAIDVDGVNNFAPVVKRRKRRRYTSDTTEREVDEDTAEDIATGNGRAQSRTHSVVRGSSQALSDNKTTHQRPRHRSVGRARSGILLSEANFDAGYNDDDRDNVPFDEHAPDSQVNGDTRAIGPPKASINGFPRELVTQEGDAVDTSYTGTVVPETQSSKNDSTSVQPALSSQIRDADASNSVELPEHQPDSIAPVASPQMFVPSKTLLQPIPQVTPSKFKTIVPTMRPMPQIAPGQLQRIVAESTKHIDPSVPASSIETDFSPDKSKRKGKERAHVVDDDDIESLISPSAILRARGLELAEENLAQQRAKRQKVTRRQLDEFISGGGHRSAANGADRDEDQTQAIARTPISDDEALFDAFVDLDGGVGSDVDAAVAGGVDASSRREKSGEVRGDASALDDEDGESSMQFGGTDVMDDPNDPNADGIIRRPHTPSSATSRSEEVDDRLLATPGKFNGLHELPNQPATHEINQIFETPTRQLNSALGLLNKKSEEITELKGERQTLLERIAELESTLAVHAEHTPAPHVPVDETVNEEPELSEMKRRVDDMQSEHESLAAELKLIKIARDDAENNAQFFRELYGKASAFTDDLRNENKALEERATLAERQVAEGLDLIRKTFEARNHKLTEQYLKATARLKLIETQAERTDDDVRRRAEQFFEQQSEIACLEKRIELLKDDHRSLKRERDDLLVNLRRLEEERDDWSSECPRMDFELRRMKVELARFAARERSVKQAWNLSAVNDDDSDAEGELEDPDEEEVHVCQWAVNDEGEWCGALLPTQQDLQDHLFVVGHL